MVVKIYISGISGNKEVKKRQQRVLMILDSKNVQYETIDITEPGREDEKEFMQANSTARDSKHPLPPQIFNNDDYCGDYEAFDLANEMDELDKFLKPDTLDDDESAEPSIGNKDKEDGDVRQNGNASSREVSTDKDVSVAHSDADARHSNADDEGEHSKTADADESAKSIADDDVDDMEDSADKNEEKSDSQEKEE